MSAPYWIGVDVGGTKILSGLYDDSFRLLTRSKLATESEQGGQAVFGRIAQSVENIIKEAQIRPEEVKGMGLAVPGQILPHSRIVRYAPNLGWRDYDLTPLFPESWTWPVHLENDVRMGTYGEWAHGAAKGALHVFGVFVGTGVGGGLILNGQLYNGFNGHAGEIGHIPIHWKKGHTLEGIAGRRCMMKRAEKLLGESPKKDAKAWKELDLATIKSSQLAKLYQKQDPVAMEVIEDAAKALGAAMGGVINLLSPEVIVIGGGVAGALGDPFQERAWQVAQTFALPRATENVRCVKAMLGDDAGVMGAATFAKARTEETAR
jgi:glucokinase